MISEKAEEMINEEIEKVMSKKVERMMTMEIEDMLTEKVEKIIKEKMETVANVEGTENSNSLTKLKNDQEMMKSRFLELLQSCENFQSELDRLNGKNKAIEKELVRCRQEIAIAERDKDNLNKEVEAVKSALHSTTQNWEVDRIERQREFEDVQYNLSILYQQFQENINNGNYIRERDVQKLSGDFDSGITADRDSQASSSFRRTSTMAT